MARRARRQRPGFLHAVALLAAAPGAALHISNSSDELDYVTKPCWWSSSPPENARTVSLLENTRTVHDEDLTRYPPRGTVEQSTDIREELKKMGPSFARSVMQLAGPLPEDDHLLREAALWNGTADPKSRPNAKCTVTRFDQYAYCEELLGKAPGGGGWAALSFGGMGRDAWSDHMRTKYDLKPHVYDCYNPQPIKGTTMHEACIGSRSQVVQGKIDGKNYVDMAGILKDRKNRSTLVKLDIERSEFGVLKELSEADMQKIALLNVEFHFFINTRCCGFGDLKALFERLQRHFVVVDGAAVRWGPPLGTCGIEDGYQWPLVLTVSYVARDLL